MYYQERGWDGTNCIHPAPPPPPFSSSFTLPLFLLVLLVFEVNH